MKRFLMFMFMVVFLANSFVVSAWAKPCLFSDGKGVPQVMASSVLDDMSEDMPCHENSKPEMSHCDGVCLCLHVAVSKVHVLNESTEIPQISQALDLYISGEDLFVSMGVAPPYKPPKNIS